MKLSDNKSQDQEAKIVIVEFILVFICFLVAAHLGWLENH